MSRSSLLFEPVPPFRLNLTVWTLRRRPDGKQVGALGRMPVAKPLPAGATAPCVRSIPENQTAIPTAG